MDAHDMRSRALLALVLADQDAVERLTANFRDSADYVETWLQGQGHSAEKAAWLAPYLYDSLANMTTAGVLNADRRG